VHQLLHDEGHIGADHQEGDQLHDGFERDRGHQPVLVLGRIRVAGAERDGKAVFNYPFLNPSFDAVQTMLDHPQVVIGLGDSGAHVGQIMDSSLPTYFLKYWVKERQHFTLEQAIRKLTLDTAQLFGIQGRGVIRQGAYADLNVIDFDNLRLPPPTFVQDLPAGGSRYIQQSAGYKHTLVNGQVFMDGLEHTGAFAGQVLRSA